MIRLTRAESYGRAMAIEPDPDMITDYRQHMSQFPDWRKFLYAAGALSAIVDQGAKQHANTCDGHNCTTCDFLQRGVSLSMALRIEMGPPDDWSVFDKG